jgi:hypothetical protein
VKFARIEVYVCIASRWFVVRGAANNPKFYIQEQNCCVKKLIIYLHYGKEVNKKN